MQPSFDRRVALARAHAASLDADALLVTHLSNIAWLTGFFGSSAALLLTERSLQFLTDFRYRAHVERLISERHFPSGATLVVTDRSLDEASAAAIAEGGSEAIAVEAEHLPVRRFRRLESLLPKGVQLIQSEPFLERLRAVKDEEELGIYREAAGRLADVAARIPGMVMAGLSELAVAAEIDYALKRGGFQRPAFETIVASGPNSTLPHARPGTRVLEEGDPVVLDFGGVYGGYCLDLTRTAFIGQPTKEFLALFEAVSAAQAAAIGAVRDGVRASEIDAAARDLLAGRGLGEAFGHATGHGLGIDVHEFPRIGRRPSDGEDPVVTCGMIFTVEPGAYVPGLGGVRIEDDVLVGAGGADVLTAIPRELIIPGAR
ncbi:MAG TPA: Xaa-Pro peptidase family protein [Vicinamibacterales bacterium]|nr:Xaa-Pro peptidase family protein [Vicinamibacterales bacterium]